MTQKRYIIIESCGKCPNSRQKGGGHWYCNAPGKTPWITVLDGKPILPERIPLYCPLPIQNERDKVLFNSTDLLLLANDEWKRREERKHNHEEIPWVAGFINGFLTDKKWARDYVDKLWSKQGEP